MVVANTLAYSNTVTTVKSLINRPPVVEQRLAGFEPLSSKSVVGYSTIVPSRGPSLKFINLVVGDILVRFDDEVVVFAHASFVSEFKSLNIKANCFLGQDCQGHCQCQVFQHPETTK
jgi:hypothetical protein